jgi:CubicO group peptidase (beta-lactamase class C family)
VSPDSHPRRAPRAPLGSSPATISTANAIRDHFVRVAERDHVPGIAYAVIDGSRIAYDGSVGVLRANGAEPPGPHTASRICSMTKSFVAAAVLTLRDQGRLKLDDPLTAYVPDVALKTPTADSPAITVRSLLTMSSGLPADDPWGDRLIDLSRHDVDALFRAGASFAHAPGTTYEYSNLGWVMLGRVIATVTGMPAQAFVTASILRPLGMLTTTWDPPRAGSVMTGQRWRDDAWSEATAPLKDGNFAPMAGLWTTVEDLARWISFFLDAFPARDDVDDAPLCRATRREMQQVHRAWPSQLDPTNGRLTAGGYGFGLMVTHDLRFGHIVGHPGGLPGFGSYMRWLPDRGVGVVALGNVTYAPMDVATIELLEMLDESGELPARRRLAPSPGLLAAMDGLSRLLNDWDDRLADTLFSTNVFLDDERERRRGRSAELRERYGPLASGEMDAASATSGAFTLHGPRGEVHVSIMLSPEVPPRIQWYELAEASLDASPEPKL